MEPNKLDKQFKDSLDNRVISPSPMAWDRLDSMLTAAEEKKGTVKLKTSWLYIAAGFIGIMLAATLFFRAGQGTAAVPVTNSVVIQENNQELKQNYNGLTVKPEINTTAIQPQSVISNTAIAATSKEVKTGAPKTTSPSKKQMVNSTEPAEVIIKPNTVNNEMEAENLLAQVADNTAQAKKQTVKVDAGKLLNSVENELDDNYRYKTIQTITKNYNIVKATLANRNHQ